MKTAIILLLAMLISPEVFGDVPEDQLAEVEHLIAYLGDSDCEMIRNGRVHDGAEGARHVQRKYNHFREHISSTEEFIELAASKSTLSGRAYQVHCPGSEPMPSSDWLLQELDAYRGQ